MDAGYGVDTDLRTSITALGLSYVAGIQSHTMGAWHRAGPPRSGRVMSDHRSCCAVMTTGRPRSRSLGRPCQGCLGHDHMAGSHGGEVVLALRPCACSCRASGLLARRQSAEAVRCRSNGPTAKRAIKYWVVDASGDVVFRQPSHCQAAMVDRTRLSGNSSRRSGRTFPRTGLARLQPSRHPLHCGLWTPILRASNHSPLREIVPPRCTHNSPDAKLTSPEDPPLRPERVPNSIATTRR